MVCMFAAVGTGVLLFIGGSEGEGLGRAWSHAAPAVVLTIVSLPLTILLALFSFRRGAQEVAN